MQDLERGGGGTIFFATVGFVLYNFFKRGYLAKQRSITLEIKSTDFSSSSPDGAWKHSNWVTIDGAGWGRMWPAPFQKKYMPFFFLKKKWERF